MDQEASPPSFPGQPFSPRGPRTSGRGVHVSLAAPTGGVLSGARQKVRADVKKYGLTAWGCQSVHVCYGNENHRRRHNRRNAAVRRLQMEPSSGNALPPDMLCARKPRTCRKHHLATGTRSSPQPPNNSRLGRCYEPDMGRWKTRKRMSNQPHTASPPCLRKLWVVLWAEGLALHVTPPSRSMGMSIQRPTMKPLHPAPRLPARTALDPRQAAPSPGTCRQNLAINDGQRACSHRRHYSQTGSGVRG